MSGRFRSSSGVWGISVYVYDHLCVIRWCLIVGERRHFFGPRRTSYLQFRSGSKGTEFVLNTGLLLIEAHKSLSPSGRRYTPEHGVDHGRPSLRKDSGVHKVSYFSVRVSFISRNLHSRTKERDV